MKNHTAKRLPSVEKIKEALDYNPATGVFVWRKRADMPANWNRRWPGKVAGSVQSSGHIAIGLWGTSYKAHRLAWMWIHGSCDMDLDHKDGNPANNAIDNLRQATMAQNMANRKRARGKLLPKGVHPARGRYRAIIRKDGVVVNLGAYATIEEAEAAYAAASAAYHGEFARLA